jgi:hypothetical protein
MRFLIVPALPTAYDRRMIAGLARALRALGHEAEAAGSPLSERQVVARCAEINADIVIEINRLRPIEPPLPDHVRHIAWFQDVFTGTFAEARDRIRNNDIVYTLGAADDLGITSALDCKVDCLFTGVDEEIITATSAVTQDIDFSLCGFLRAPFPQVTGLAKASLWLLNILLDSMPVPTSWISAPLPHAEVIVLRDTIMRNYQPLRGELDIHKLAAITSHAAQDYIEHGPALLPGFVAELAKARRRSTIERYISSLVREYPRMLDRIALIDSVLAISTSLELYGTGWDYHPRFQQYYRGNLTSQEGLLGVYRRTRLNLANNTHGLGLHSRTIECMAVGSFIFMHKSPRELNAGGMRTSFEPGVHYGSYTPETIEGDAAYWLRDEARRRDVGMRAAAVVKEGHLWRHRAQQITRDLSR